MRVIRRSVTPHTFPPWKKQNKNKIKKKIDHCSYYYDYHYSFFVYFFSWKKYIAQRTINTE